MLVKQTDPGGRLRGRRLLGHGRGRGPRQADAEVPGPLLVHAPQGHGKVDERAPRPRQTTTQRRARTGKIDIKGVVAAAKAGVEMHYIEDESAGVLAQLPESLRFLAAFKG